MTLTVATAIAVPEPWAAQLRDARQSYGDPAASGTPTHVTLLGPTDIDEPMLRAYEEHLEQVAGSNPAFRIHLRGTGSFRPVSAVVFVALAEGISSCEQLAAAVRAGPVHREHDFPYHPHITVAQELPEPVLDRAFAELADFEAEFPVTGFTLYEHVEDAWRVHKEYALTG